MGKKVMLKLLGGFFALMLACTLLSRASASLTVAVVQTAPPGKMALSHRVTGSGKVVADQQQAVSVEAQDHSGKNPPRSQGQSHKAENLPL